MTAAAAKKAPAKAPQKKVSVAAREAEAGDGLIVVEHLGIELKVPVRGEVTIAVIDKFRERDSYGATRDLLGPDQWKALSDAGMTQNSLNELGAKLKEAWGN